MTRVTVLMSVFGEHVGWATLPAVVDAWLDQDLSCDVVIATSGELDLAGSLPADVGDRVRVVETDHPRPTVSRLMNAAAAHATGEWLYLSDADVAPLGRDYLTRAVAAARGVGGAFTNPKMFRLVGPSPDGPASRWQPPADWMSVCFVRTEPDGRLARYPGESYRVHDDRTLWADPPPDAFVLEPFEFSRRPALHWGATVVRREDLIAVGGYCEQYEGWGCEDEDLLHKLAARMNVIQACVEMPEILCVHFEHRRPYDTPDYAANQARLVSRREAGPEAMIAADLDAAAKRAAAGAQRSVTTR
ncbi:galactosyltransferase-related protein [Polymorphospora lycopeni]|uniref:Galactosyltransferase-related protein n=1 Tax=Polymorphospora lycopeni TaxID=3140240 RepID=A0ABV5CQE1_9ACTN